MFGLCIAESYYRLGQCRLQWYSTLDQLVSARGKLDQSCTTWLVSEPVPKRRVRGNWYNMYEPELLVVSDKCD